MWNLCRATPALCITPSTATPTGTSSSSAQSRFCVSVKNDLCTTFIQKPQQPDQIPSEAFQRLPHRYHNWMWCRCHHSNKTQNWIKKNRVDWYESCLWGSHHADFGLALTLINGKLATNQWSCRVSSLLIGYPERCLREEMKHYTGMLSGWLVIIHQPELLFSGLTSFCDECFPHSEVCRFGLRKNCFSQKSQKITKSAGFIHRQTENDDTTENDVNKTDDQ